MELRNTGPWFLSLVRYLRAILAVRQGRANDAIAVIRESLTHIRELRDKFAFVYALVPLAAAAVIKGDDAWAARILGARDTVTEHRRDDCRHVGARSATTGRARGPRAPRCRSMGPRVEAGRGMSVDTLLKDIDRNLTLPPLFSPRLRSPPDWPRPCPPPTQAESTISYPSFHGKILCCASTTPCLPSPPPPHHVNAPPYQR